MIRIALVLLILIHAAIHLFGFLKAFGLASFDTISEPISRGQGILWLVVALAFSLSGLLAFFKWEIWRILAALAILCSQILIFQFWSDAKFGTLPNLIILLAALLGYFQWNFQNTIQRETQSLLSEQATKPISPNPSQQVETLPPAIQNWLRNSGALEMPPIQIVRLRQELQLKMKPEQENWLEGKAEQYFRTDPPGFVWTIDTQMNPLLPLKGRDKFDKGKGEMLIKLFSFLPVADAKGNEKVNQATLQRYLAEIVWFPSAALSPYITWEPLANNSARATMSYGGTTGAGEFHFDEEGRFQKFIAMRYQDADDEFPSEWTVKATQTSAWNGISIPVACEASWKLQDQTWTWLRLKITEIEYNPTIKAH
ncbi:DUF6920 family protein [Algoriphagus namhaensis]